MFDSKQEYLKREWRECPGLSKMPLEKRAITQGTTDFGHFQSGGASKITLGHEGVIGIDFET